MSAVQIVQRTADTVLLLLLLQLQLCLYSLLLRASMLLY